MCELDAGSDGDVREILYAQRSGQFDLSTRPRGKSLRCAFGEKRRAAREAGKNHKGAQQQRGDAEKNPVSIDLAKLHAVPYPPVPHAGPEGAGAAAFFLKSAPAFLARTRRDSETGPTFCCALASLANGQSEGCGRGSGPASCHDPVQEENRSEADQYNC